MNKSLKERFDTIRHQNLKEDFEVGQAAQALHTLKKAAKDYLNFLENDFTPAFKDMLNRPETSEDAASDLGKMLGNSIKRLADVSSEVETFVYNFDTYENPKSSVRGRHRENRWTRWEHRTPRHLETNDE